MATSHRMTAMELSGKSKDPEASGIIHAMLEVAAQLERIADPVVKEFNGEAQPADPPIAAICRCENGAHLSGAIHVHVPQTNFDGEPVYIKWEK
jgi:hypothetical protein